MPRRPNSAPDPEVRRKVMEAIRRDLERDYETAPETKERLDSLERGLQQARGDQPNHRPIERELLLAYISRVRSYNFPLLLPDGDSVSDVSLAAREKYWRERPNE